MKLISTIVASIVFLIAIPTYASGLDDLQRFYSEIKSYSANFEQKVVDEKMQLLEASDGAFSIQRPGKFNWHYTSPSEQLIIGDGKQVWIYDVELEQITHRKTDAAVSQTPAILLSGQGDLSENFVLDDIGQHDGLDWVRMLPKSRESGFTDIRVGFSAGKLKLLEIKDSFGQTTRMNFSNVEENVEIAAEKFSFVPPPGVDVLEEGG